MAFATISIQLNDRAAQLYEVAPEEKQQSLQQLISYLVQEFAESTPQSLLLLMNEMSREAESKGLTPKILESILNDDE